MFGVSQKTLIAIVVGFVVLMWAYNRIPQFRKIAGAGA